MVIKEITSTVGLIDPLEALLLNCIYSGASVGFVRPINDEELTSYWKFVGQELDKGYRKLFLAYDGENIIGSVQLSICSKPNGSHRGEVEKLMVHTNARGKGVSKKLMSFMEKVSFKIGLSLLVLDTRLGDVASSLYLY